MRVLVSASAGKSRGAVIEFLARNAGVGSAASRDDPLPGATYCTLSTGRRCLIAEASGHAQEAWRVAAKASIADVAILEVDGFEALSTRTRTYFCMLALARVSRVVIALSGLHAHADPRARLREIEAAFGDLARRIGPVDFICIPLPATDDESIPESTGFAGPTLIDCLENVPLRRDAAARAPAQLADQFNATVVWSGAEPLLRGRTYQLATGDTTAQATVAPLKYKLNVETLEHVAAERLDADEIGVCEMELDRAIAFDPYGENRETGSFVLNDPVTHAVVGFGMLNFALRRAHNVHRYALTIDKASRSALKSQKSCVLWLTGVSASGKSTIANMIDKKLHAMGRHTYVLDGDNVRHGLNKDLGFTAEDRVENIRRIAEVAKLMVDAGLIVLAAFISPFRSERRMARDLLAAGEFIEIFVDTPLAVAEQRDPKGLYKKARRGEIKNFTGIDSPYEVPEAAEIAIETEKLSAEAAADRVIEYLRNAGVLAEQR
jgi:bifunctional enzyme CysN/CysC